VVTRSSTSRMLTSPSLPGWMAQGTQGRLGGPRTKDSNS